MLLRLPRESDRAEFMALLTRSAAFLRPWWSTPPGTRAPDFSEFVFDRLRATCNTNESRRFIIIGDRRDGVPEESIVGGVSISQISRAAHQNAILGYWMGVDFAGRGLMTRAVAGVLRHGFEEMKLHRMEANIMPRNKASSGVVTKLGFRPEGIAQRYLRINGVWEDHRRWAMTREEWRELRAGHRVFLRRVVVDAGGV